MMKKGKIEDSPFYVEYTGKIKHNGKHIKTYAYHVKKDFVNPLKEFFNERFGDLSANGIMEQIVYDYYFRYAHDRNSTGKTIIALIDESEITSDNPQIMPLFVHNQYPKDNKYGVLIDKGIIDNYNQMQYLAFVDRFDKLSDDLQDKIISLFINDGFSISGFDVFDKLKDLDENSFKDLLVIQIPLNNYLDTKINGVYCYENDDADNSPAESKHVGLAIIRNWDFPMVYSWNLNEDFGIDVEVISKVELEYLKNLCTKYNPEAFTFVKLAETFEFSNNYKLKEVRKEIARYEKNIANLKDQEQLLLNEMKNENDSK